MDFLATKFSSVLAVAEGGEAADHGIGWGIFYYAGIVFITLIAFMFLACAGFRRHLFVGLPAKLAEHLYFFLRSLTTVIIGPHGAVYVPFLMAIWLFVFVSNVYGLIFPYTPTADWSLNLGLALITFTYVQFQGIRTNGIFGYLRHFAGPRITGIHVIMVLLVSGLIFVVEILSEFMKVFSLSIRLFGNIEGGHIVKDALDNVIGGVPLGGLLLPIKFFTCILQAFIWVTLTCVYLAAVTSHEEEHEAAHERAHVPASAR